jgi:hypothetical protein
MPPLCDHNKTLASAVFLSLVNWYSGYHWKVKKPAAAPAPPIALDVNDIARRYFNWRSSIPACMASLAIHISSMHSKADDLACVLIHHDHYPVTFQQDRFTGEEIDAPQAVFGMVEPFPTRYY